MLKLYVQLQNVLFIPSEHDRWVQLRSQSAGVATWAVPASSPYERWVLLPSAFGKSILRWILKCFNSHTESLVDSKESGVCIMDDGQRRRGR